MRKKFSTLVSSAFLLFFVVLLIFGSLEERVSKQGTEVPVKEKDRSVDTNAAVDRDQNFPSVSATKRDLLITNEIHLNGRFSVQVTAVGRQPLPPILPNSLSSPYSNPPLSPNDGRVLSASFKDTVSQESPISPKKAAVNISSSMSNSNVPHVTVALSSRSSAPESSYSSIRVNVPNTAIKRHRSTTDLSNATTSSSPVNRVNTTLNHTKAFVAGSGMKPICSQTPPNLVGLVPIDKMEKSLKIIEEQHGEGVETGGFYAPPSCLARHRVAIVIPFRDRNEHLHIFLNHMLPFLKKQQLEFAIYIVELAPKEKFNRAMLMNIGFREAQKDKEWQCFVFHDVDLLPESDKNIYSCPPNPRHMSAAVDTMNYKLPYHSIFGGVSVFSRAHFELINGFSNLFFGWGGEDDDLYYRTTKKGLKITRYPMTIARYTMLKHTKDKPNPDRFKYLKEGTNRMGEDGLNKLSYRVLGIERHKLFTKILVSIDENAVKKGFQLKKRRLKIV